MAEEAASPAGPSPGSVVITGAAGGIGSAVARLLDSQGRPVALLDLHPDRCRPLASVPLGRLETPDEVADAVAFLLGDASRYVTGQALNVCGGVEMDQQPGRAGTLAPGSWPTR